MRSSQASDHADYGGGTSPTPRFGTPVRSSKSNSDKSIMMAQSLGYQPSLFSGDTLSGS